MTRHNDEAHALSTRHEAQTRHDETQPLRSRWSDEAHDETHTRHTPHEAQRQHLFRGAPCRVSCSGAGIDGLEARDVEDYEAWLDSDGQLDLEEEEDPFFSAAARECNQPAAQRIFV